MKRLNRSFVIRLFTASWIALAIGGANVYAQTATPVSSSKILANDAVDNLNASLQLLNKKRTNTEPMTILADDARQKKVNSIKRQLRMIKDLMNQPMQKPPQVEQRQPQKKQPPSQSPNQLRNNPAATETKQEDQPGQSPELNNAQMAAPQKTDFPIEMTTPVDSRELAHSLFVIGESPGALGKLQYYFEQNSIQLQDDPWASCIMASCYRALGNLDKAESIYRTLAAMGDDEYLPANVARWRLGYLSKRKEMKKNFDVVLAEVAPILAKRGELDDKN